MDVTDDDFFSDDGFDDLPAGTWLQLEQDAFRATQVQTSAHQHPSIDVNQSSRGVENLVSRSHQGGLVEQPLSVNATLKPPARLHTGLTNDYDALDVGELDAEVLNDDTESTIALDRNVSLSNLGGFAHNGPVTGEESRPVEQVMPEPMEVEGPSHYHDMHMVQDHHKEETAGNGDPYKHLMQDLASAKLMAETKAGEIAIIRSNQARLVENYDRQLAAMRKAMAEEVSRHKEEVEAARAEGKMFATENAFLKQDLAEESMRNHAMRKRGHVEEKPAPVTPKKSRALPFRDGFDDDEIVAVSPSKSARSKRVASVVPGKRKRRASQESPTPLELSPQADRMATDPGIADLSDEAMVDAMADLVPEQPPKKVDNNNLLLTKRILNHRTYPNEQPDIEVLSRMAFPSEPGRMLSTLLLDEIAKLEVGSYLVEYVQVVVSLWSRALKEKFYQPVPLFMSITRYILQLDPSPSDIIDHLVPILQDSGDVNGVPRFKHSPVSTRRGFGQMRQTPQSELSPLVDSSDALGILYQMAYRCLHLPRDLERFWRHIRYDFVLMMLNGAQRLRDIILTLGLLMTSIRAQSFGSIHDTEQDQAANETYIVERVANLLSESPQVDEGEPSPTGFEICSMRLEALSLLSAIAFNPNAPLSVHGSGVIATHPTVLARLIRAMHDELDALYSSPPDKDLHTALVNGLMRLVYAVIQRHKGQIDLQSKLCRVPGGKQKFLVVFTRLAFSEGLVLEAGIDDETVEMAHEMLDDAVNPQEAEALQEAFSGSSAKREE